MSFREFGSLFPSRFSLVAQEPPSASEAHKAFALRGRCFGRRGPAIVSQALVCVLAATFEIATPSIAIGSETRFCGAGVKVHSRVRLRADFDGDGKKDRIVESTCLDLNSGKGLSLMEVRFSGLKKPIVMWKLQFDESEIEPEFVGEFVGEGDKFRLLKSQSGLSILEIEDDVVVDSVRKSWWSISRKGARQLLSFHSTDQCHSTEGRAGKAISASLDICSYSISIDGKGVEFSDYVGGCPMPS